MIRWLMVLAVSAASSAWACSCRTGGPVFLRDGTTNVPTNVVLRALFKSRPSEERITLHTEDGTFVPLEFSDGPGSFLFSFKPTAKLAPNTRYVFDAAGAQVTFTTGATEDLVAPSQPTLVSSTYKLTQSGTSCGDRRDWKLDVTGGDDETSPRDDLILLVHSADSVVGATWLGDARLGSGLCAQNFVPPEGASMSLRVQAMDLAGNVSELSMQQQVAGCSAAPGGALLMLALAALLRRRR